MKKGEKEMKKVISIIVLILCLILLVFSIGKPSEDYWTMYVYSPNPEEESERVCYEYMGKINFVFLKNNDEVFIIDETDLVLYFEKTNDCDLVAIDNLPIFKTKEITLSENNFGEYFVVTYDDIVQSEKGRITYVRIIDGDEDCEGYSIRKDYFFTFTTSEYVQAVSKSSEIYKKISDENTIEYTISDPKKVYK